MACFVFWVCFVYFFNALAFQAMESPPTVPLVIMKAQKEDEDSHSGGPSYGPL